MQVAGIKNSWSADSSRFHRYGAHYFLSEIVARGAAQQLNPSKLETEYAKVKPAEEKIVAATADK